MTCWDGFGGVWDGRPFWVGDFNGDGRADILFYYPGDDNWWLGTHNGSELQWTFAGNTTGFGHGINDGRPFWVGDFNGDGRADILFYYPGDDNWWLGTHNGSELQWTFAGNTTGFGHGINDGRPFWVGNFSRPDRTEILFYYPATTTGGSAPTTAANCNGHSQVTPQGSATVSTTDDHSGWGTSTGWTRRHPLLLSRRRQLVARHPQRQRTAMDIRR